MNLPANTPIYGRNDWTTEQLDEVHAYVKAARAAYADLYRALEAADADMAGLAEDCAIDNMDSGLTDACLGYWPERRRHLAIAAGQIWEDACRNVNTETGLSIY